MKNRWSLLFSTTATILLLSACGTDTSNAETDKEATGVVEDSSVTSKPTDSEKTEKPAEETVTQEKNLLENAEVVMSEEQAYKLSVLPDYTLTSEEPGRDSLMANEDETVFMRIETVPKEEGTYDYMVENMGEVLSASADGSAPEELTDETKLPAGDGIENVKASSVQAETGQVTGIVFEKDEMIIRLTIYDSTENEHFEKFLRMGETISKE